MHLPSPLRTQLLGALFTSSLVWAGAVCAADEPSEDRGADPAGAGDAGAPSEPHEVESIVVVGHLIQSPAPKPSTAAVVSQEELEKMEHDDVHQVLLQVPGVQVRGEDGFGLRPNIGIRGTSPDRSSKVTLLEDGVLLGPAPYSAPAAYYFPQVTRMTAVEVYKGGAQQRFGPHSQGGAINLVTAEVPKELKLRGDLAFGEYGYLKAHGQGGYGTDQVGFLLEAIHVQSSGFKDLDTGGPTGFDKNEVMAKWRLQSDADAHIFQRLDVKLGLSTERSSESYLGLTDEDFQADPYRRYAASALDEMNWYRGQSEVKYTVLPSDSLELEFIGYRHQLTRDWFRVDGVAGAPLDDVLKNPDSPVNATYYDVLTGAADSGGADEQLLMVDNYRWYTSQGLQTKVLSHLTTGLVDHDLEGGARLHYDEINRLHTQYAYAMVGSGANSIGAPESTGDTGAVTANNRGSTHALSLHLIDTMEILDFTLTPGVRTEFVWTRFDDTLDADLSNQRTQIGVLPGMGVHYALLPQLGILAGGYRGFGPVAPQAVLVDTPKESLPKPETSTTWEAGTRYSTDSTHAELIGFLVNYQNLTASCSQAIGCSSANDGQQYDGGRVRVFGLESLLAHSFRAADLVFPQRATYALTLSGFLDEFSSENPEWGDVEIGDELPYVPRHQGTLSSGVGVDTRWSVDANLTLASEARESAGRGPIESADRVDAYALVGLAGKVRLFGGVWLYSRATNLTDSAYLVSRRPHGARPGAPRWVQIGIKWEQ